MGILLSLLHIFRTPFYKNTSGGLLLSNCERNLANCGSSYSGTFLRGFNDENFSSYSNVATGNLDNHFTSIVGPTAKKKRNILHVYATLLISCVFSSSSLSISLSVFNTILFGLGRQYLLRFSLTEFFKRRLIFLFNTQNKIKSTNP